MRAAAAVSAALVGIVGLAVHPLLTSFPDPYTGHPAAPLDAVTLGRFPEFPPALTGDFAANERLTHATRLFEGQIQGAESVAVSPDGTLVMLDKFGFVHRARKRADDTDPKSSAYELLPASEALYIGPGRPLGFHLVDGGAAVVVCDSLKGLLRVDLAEGTVTVMANSVSVSPADDDGAGPGGAGGRGPRPINYANDLDVASDGTVYFTSSTAGVVARHPTGFYDTMRSFLLNMVAGDRTGRLLKHSPSGGAPGGEGEMDEWHLAPPGSAPASGGGSGQTTEVLAGLWYANGVTLAHDEQSVLVVETLGFRVIQHWIAGPKTGISTTLIDHLPGFPDGITRSADGNYWLCLVAPLSPLLKLLPLGSTVRYLMSHLLTSPLTKHFVKTWGCVIKLSPEGKVLSTMMDTTGSHVSSVSAVTEFEGNLFLGNLQGDFVSMLSLEDL